MTNGRTYLRRVPFLLRHFSNRKFAVIATCRTRCLRSAGDAQLLCARGVQIGCRMKLATQNPHDRLTLWGQHVVCVEWFLGVQGEKTSCQTSPSVVSFGLCRLLMMEEMSLRRVDAGVHQGHTVDLNPSLRPGSPGSRLANYNAVRCVT